MKKVEPEHLEKGGMKYLDLTKVVRKPYHTY